MNNSNQSTLSKGGEVSSINFVSYQESSLERILQKVGGGLDHRTVTLDRNSHRTSHPFTESDDTSHRYSAIYEKNRTESVLDDRSRNFPSLGEDNSVGRPFATVISGSKCNPHSSVTKILSPSSSILPVLHDYKSHYVRTQQTTKVPHEKESFL